jgi:hypothetical protein
LIRAVVSAQSEVASIAQAPVLKTRVSVLH